METAIREPITLEEGIPFKVLAGNPGRRPLPDKEPDVEIKIPDPPELLEGVALDQWQRLSREFFKLGIMSEIDRDALAIYCKLYDRWTEAEGKIKTEGLTLKTINGNIIQSPYVGIVNRCVELMNKYLIEFGMTPSSRTRVAAKKIKKTESKNPWDEF